MSMQLLEPVSILLRVHISFLLQELLHFRFGHFLGLLHFPLSTDLGLASWRFGSASPWIEVYCASILLEELFHLPLRRLSSPLHAPLT